MAKDTLEIKLEVSAEVVRWATEDRGVIPNMLKGSLEADLGRQATEAAVKLLEEADTELADKESNQAAPEEAGDAPA